MIKRYRYEIILFIVDAIAMIIELVASRILSPYFGNTNLVWTSVIGIILLSSSIGNYYGGKIADGENVEKKLKLILCCTTLFIFIIPLIQNFVVSGIASAVSSIKVGAILATISLFFIPSALMGLLMPIIIKLKLNCLETAGSISGRLNAIATIGGIAGTFIGGFCLIPNFGSVQVLFLISILMAVCVLLVDIKLNINNTMFLVVVVALSVFPINSFAIANEEKGNMILAGETEETVYYDTQYGRVYINNEFENGEKIRVLHVDGGTESATFTDAANRNELAYEYTKYYDLMFAANNDIKDTLLIGGGGYSYPKYYISHFEDKNMDVVEIDNKVTEIAKKYFYLDDLIEDYNLEETNRLQLISEDGRTFLNKNQKKYDAILNDAFSGYAPVKTLTTLEAASHIKRSLNENGVYLTNIISALDGADSKFLRAEVNTLKQVFKNVYIVPCEDAEDRINPQNHMVVATDDILSIEGCCELVIDENELILSDNYCPIESLIPKL